MSRCASGSIQVVTNVARLRAGSPSMREVLGHQSHRVRPALIPVSGNSRLGTSWVAKRFPNRAASASVGAVSVMWLSFGGADSRARGRWVSVGLGDAVRALRCVGTRPSPGREHQGRSDEEAHGAEQRARHRDAGVEHLAGARQDVAGQSRGHEEDRSEHVQPGDPPRQRPRLDAAEAADGEDPERAGHEEQDRAEEVRPPDVPVLLLHGGVVRPAPPPC